MPSVPYDHALVQRAWRSGLTFEAARSTFMSVFEGKGKSHAFPVQDRPGGSGDRLTLRYATLNRNEPKTSVDQILGNEEVTEVLEDNIYLRYHVLDGKIDNQQAEQDLVSFDQAATERSRIAQEWAEVKEKSICHHMCGMDAATITGSADYAWSAGNLVVAPDSESWIFAPDSSGANANEAAVAGDATSLMTTDVIDDCVKQATSLDYRQFPIVPCQTPWGMKYVCVVHGDGYQQIRDNSSATNIYDIETSKIKGGEGSANSPLITGEGMIYDNTVILRSDFCGRKIANAQRGFFFGAQAGYWIYGSGFHKGEHLGWSTHQQHRRWSCMSDTVRGFKRAIVNGKSFGSITFSHYTALTTLTAENNR